MIKKIIIFAALFALFFLIFNSFYTYPSADDFTYYIRQEKVGFYEFQKWHYLYWGGRYFPNAVLGSFSFHGNGLYFYRALSVFVISTLALAFYQFSLTFFEKKNALFFASLLFLTYCFSLYSVAQEFYWLPGSFTYTISVTLSLFIWSFLKNLKNNFVFLCTLLSIFILNGTNEVAMIFFNASLLLLLIFKALNSQKITARFYLVLTLSIVFMLTSILAPGNSVRSLSENNSNTHDILFTLPRAAYRSFMFLHEKFFIFFIVGFVVFYTSNLQGLRLKFAEKFPVIFKFLSLIFPFGVLCSGVALSYFATARIPPERTVNTIAFYFLMSIILSALFYKANFLQKELGYNEKWVICSGLLILMSIFLVSNELRRNASDLLTGRSKQFDKEMNERNLILKNSSEKDMKVKKISVLPVSIFFKDISANPNNFFNRYYAQFYHKNSIVVQKQ